MMPAAFLGLSLLGAEGAGAQTLRDIDFAGVRAIQNLIPNRVEGIVDFYDAEHGSVIRNSHAVGHFTNCTATWVAPYVVMSASHCGGTGFNGINMEAYRDRSMVNFPPTFATVRCQRFLATGFYSSNADFALWDCRPRELSDADPDVLTESANYPGGVQYGRAVVAQWPVREGSEVYSAWRNPVTNHPVLRNQGQSTLYSAGKVTAVGVMNRWAGPNFIGCAGDDATQNLVDAHTVQMDLFTAPGGSGSAQFSSETHRLVVGPTATGSATSRTALSIDASLGHGLPEGDRMIVETYIPQGRPRPDRIPTRFRYVDPQTVTDRDVLANCYDITQMSKLAITDRNKDRVYDVIAETMAWNWVQPHHFFNFTDPLTRARWRLNEDTPVSYAPILSSDVATTLNPLARGPMRRVAVENAEGALILQEGKRITLPPEMNNLSRGAHRITVEFAATQDKGELEIRSRCSSVTYLDEITIPARGQAPLERMLLGTTVELRCDKPEISLELTEGGGAILVRALSFVREGDAFNFASIDERDMWTGSKDQHALFTADGEHDWFDGPGQPFFGLNVPAGSAVSLRGYALEPGRTYDLNFRAKSILDGGNPSRLTYGPVDTGSGGVVTVDGGWSNYEVRVTATARADRNGAITFFRSEDAPGVTIIDHLLITPQN
jgi:hypothetical protein